MYNPLLFNTPLLPLLLLLTISRDIIKVSNSKVLYTALGDSIAYGSGASFYYGYTNYFFDFLKSLFPGSSFKNLSKPGTTSNGLLQQLVYNAKTRFFIKNSSIVTICVGGNNILKSSTRNYTAVNTQLADTGVKKFSEDWGKILFLTRTELNPKAIIYAMTIYNPFRIDDPLFQTAEHYITSINGVIMNPLFIQEFRYIPVDVYSYFKTDSNGLWTRFSEARKNPHPNDEGHRRIAWLHQNTPIDFH
jgi:lysophospholipase L1-like esterase